MINTWNNEPISSLTHLIGAALAIAGLVLLIVQGVSLESTIHVVTFTIFGASLFLTYLMSTLYHLLCKDRTPRTRRVFQIFDHCAIYFLIAGTYTPLVLTTLPPGWGWTLFGLVWGLAIIGAIIKSTNLPLPAWGSVVFYLTMGWLVIIAIGPLGDVLNQNTLFWLVLGGLAYTIGAIFFVLDYVVPRSRWFGMHEIFHLFVMFGSFSHFWMFFTLPA